jgi:hypothetical protein
MSYRTWEIIKVRYCEHARRQVALEADAVYPAEFLPDQPPRLLSHRCSCGSECAANQLPAGCVWNGANPLYDPFEA